jgi:hypothetical protein
MVAKIGIDRERKLKLLGLAPGEEEADDSNHQRHHTVLEVHDVESRVVPEGVR